MSVVAVDVIIHDMTHDELLRKIQDLEHYEREQISEKDSVQAELKQLHSDFADTKQNAANALADAAKQAAGLGSGAVDSTKRSYEDKQKHIQDETDKKEQRLSELEDHISEIERVLKEIKKVEPTLRDIEQKVEYWATQADDLMGTRSSGLF